MNRHDAIFLEDPPSDDLDRMLAGDLSVDDYVEAADTEYPEFTGQMSFLLRKMAAQGKIVLAVEPFLKHLLEIHEFFAEGGTPAELNPDTDQFRVYAAERDATGGLLAFYRAAASGSFVKTVRAVKEFARLDAKRFLLRDRMRAKALAEKVRLFQSSYVEAGQIHVYLWRMLRAELELEISVKPCFLMMPVVRDVGVGRHLYGPGDVLTLLYIFHPNFHSPTEDLLAARALIYNKVIEKNEITTSIDTHPHLRNELETIETVRQLSLEDCRRLFPYICRETTENAKRQVHRYIRNEKGAFSMRSFAAREKRTGAALTEQSETPRSNGCGAT